MVPSKSSELALIEDSVIAGHRLQAKATTSNVTCKLFQGFIIFFVLCLLFSVGAHCLKKHVFGNDDSDHKLFRDEMPKQGEINLLRKMLPDEVRDVDDAVLSEFEKLVKDLNITYASNDDIIKRFQTFTDNLKKIEHLQSRSTNALFGANRFALMSDDELRAYVMPYAEHSRTVSTLLSESETVDEAAAPLPTRPAFVDWRTRGVVTRVKDQGSCGSCWAFAVTATIESLRAIRGHPLEERSEQELIDCDDDNNGCHGGYRPYAFRYIKESGLTLEKLYFYMAKKQSCRKITGQKVKISGWKSFPLDESYLADWVAANGPVTIGVNVTRGMFAYKSGVFAPTAEDCAHKSLGSHALAVVGYGEENGDTYWLLKNSWGTSAGENGYLKMKRGVNSCGIGHAAFGPVA
uniref:Pept_C1 domain-containing protein n=1 Tax=Panagrellus redivivus TaxID=6233 RepID=A0A7E4V527_PANRE